MVIRDEVKRLALFLQAHGGLHRAEVIADVEFSAGLQAGEDAHGAEHGFRQRDAVKRHGGFLTSRKTARPPCPRTSRRASR